MLAPATSWIDSKNAKTLLARIHPADFMAVSHRPIVGPEVTTWGCASWRGHRYLAALEALRNKAVVAALGTFADAADKREYCSAWDLIPSVQDALNSVLGEPVLGRRAVA